MNKIYFKVIQTIVMMPASLILFVGMTNHVYAERPEFYHTLEEKKEAGLKSEIANRIKLSGLVELEAGYSRTTLKDLGKETQSDLVQSTAQIGLEATINDSLSALIIVLFEEDDTEPIALDEILMTYESLQWNVKLGRQYVPFGSYNSHFVTDPSTLSLGEMRETAALIGYNNDWISGAAFIFNGDAKLNDIDDLLLDWGTVIVIKPFSGFEVGTSLISDLADTNMEIAGNNFNSYTPGVSGYFIAEVDEFELSFEMVTATKSFERDDLDENGDGQGDHPLTWSGELAYEIDESLEIAVGISGSNQLQGAPRIQYGLATSWGFWDTVSQTVEYLYSQYDEAFGVNEDGEILEKRHTITMEIAVEF